MSDRITSRNAYLGLLAEQVVSGQITRDQATRMAREYGEGFATSPTDALDEPSGGAVVPQKQPKGGQSQESLLAPQGGAQQPLRPGTLPEPSPRPGMPANEFPEDRGRRWMRPNQFAGPPSDPVIQQLGAGDPELLKNLLAGNVERIDFEAGPSLDLGAQPTAPRRFTLPAQHFPGMEEMVSVPQQRVSPLVQEPQLEQYNPEQDPDVMQARASGQAGRGQATTIPDMLDTARGRMANTGEGPVLGTAPQSFSLDPAVQQGQQSIQVQQQARSTMRAGQDALRAHLRAQEAQQRNQEILRRLMIQGVGF